MSKARPSAASLLTSLDDLFTTQAERDEAKLEPILDIPLDQISPFPGHPFKVKADGGLAALADSIRERGVLVPALVRPLGDGYQMVAGHRRMAAAELTGAESLPCIVRDLTDEEATIAMVDSNLQREKILPSEKAFAYKMKLDAMKRQGKRTDLICAPVGEKLTSVAKLSKSEEDSARQIHRYIRLTSLIPELLKLVDDGKIAMRPAVELSYLTQREQASLYETMVSENRTPSNAQAVKIRKFSQEGRLSPEVILSIIREERGEKNKYLSFSKSRVASYFKPDTPNEVIEDTIVKALEYYRSLQRGQER